MKNIIPMSLYFLLLFVGCSSVPHFTEAQIKEESQRLNAFFDEVFESKVSRYPTYQTYLGRKTSYGILDNETEAYSDQEFQITQATLKRLKQFNYNSLSEETKTSYKILKYQLDKEIEGHKWRYHSFPLNQMFGYQSETPSFMINMHEIVSENDAINYISRLQEIKRVFSERMTFLKKQESLGIAPPHFVFSKVITDSKNIITGKPFDKNKFNSPLYEDFTSKISKLKISPARKNKLIKEAESSLLSFVHPAYLDLVSYVENIEKKYLDNKGAWSLPNGLEFYNFSLSSSTTTNLSAHEIHEIGLSEVKRIQDEMLLIMKQVDFQGSLNDFFNHMRGKKYSYPDTVAGRKLYLDEVNKVLKNIKLELPKLFKTFPKAKLVVKPVEAFREKSTATAFYSEPSLEGNRPGIYYVNLYKMADNPSYKLEALAYHEAIPGHHMQLSIANELEDLPKFRRSGSFTAYVEGWGLYSEYIPKEIGFYQDPYSDFGRLSMEIWRATRLVVDTGIHAKKWTREKAIKFMSENTPSAELETMKEIERYFVMPGQATSYKVGMMKILSLRNKAKAKLGSKFDIREFHDIVLRDGAVPLQILEDKVNDWINGKN